MTDEIITQVSKIASLKVISRTSVMQYKNTKKSLKQISEELGVSVILEGSVQKSGDSVRINAQLIDAGSDDHIWAEIYDRNIKEIFAIQSEVAQNIAAALKTKLTPAEKKNLSKHYTDNVDAYKFYRKGRYFWDARTKESFDSAEINYKKAIESDPDYALAYSGLADLYIYNQKGLSQLEAIPIASDYTNKALLLDSTLSEALTTLGFIQSDFDYDWAKSKSTLEKAIAFNPNYPDAHKFYGNLLQYTGESTERGINEIKKALALDPLSVNLNYVLGRNYYLAKKYDSAYEQLKKTLTFNPNFNLAKGNLAFTLLAKKNYGEAFELIKQLPRTGTSKIDYYQGPVLSYAYSVSGDKTRAKIELEKTLAEYPDQSPYHLARVYILLNNNDEALTRLEQAYEMRDIWMYHLKVDPTLDLIRNDPRFKALMKKMHLD
jgi:Tfp pilus assembly protein PilF